MSAVRPKCRACGQSNLKEILSLGNTPLANALLTAGELKHPEKTYPLDLVFCPDCTLVQITETVPPEELFRDYFYFSSFSDTTLQNACNIVERMSAERNLGGDSLVVEIASNDGYLLKNYLQRGIPVLGIEPARNIARVAEERGIDTLCEFFDETIARQLQDEGKQADVIHANNVVAHTAELHEVVAGIGRLLKPDGVAVIENHYIKDLVDHVEFDSVYHEHLCYFSATSFERLFRQHNLIMVDAERTLIHGGSLRVFFQRSNGPRSMEKQGIKHVNTLLEDEMSWGLDKFEYYEPFGGKVERLRCSLIDLLKDIKADGKRIAVYGASAKSTTLMSYFGIGSDTLEFVVDRNTAKQGHFTPGSHLPIYAPEKLLESQPDYVLLLAWNFSDEVLAQQAEYRQRGGKFIIPIPELKVV